MRGASEWRDVRPGKQGFIYAKVQELRGLVNHWRYAIEFWRYVASPINALLEYADSANTWIRRDNDQVWLAFWNWMALIRRLGDEDDMWRKMFTGKLEQGIAVPKRAGRPRGQG